MKFTYSSQPRGETLSESMISYLFPWISTIRRRHPSKKLWAQCQDLKYAHPKLSTPCQPRPAVSLGWEGKRRRKKSKEKSKRQSPWPAHPPLGRAGPPSNAQLPVFSPCASQDTGHPSKAGVSSQHCHSPTLAARPGQGLLTSLRVTGMQVVRPRTSISKSWFVSS